MRWRRTGHDLPVEGHPLVARDLVCQLGGREVLHGVTVDVRAGEVLALVGPNGAGKSTLLGALSGDITPASGSVLLEGSAIADWHVADLARARSVLAQSNDVSFGFTARDVVQMGRNPWWGTPRSLDDDKVVARALRTTETEHVAERVFSRLSGGERARVSLARVLAQETRIVLLDEPTAALDLRHQEEVMRVARELARAGRTVVAVVHDLSLAGAWCDRIAVLDRGRLMAHGVPEDVLTPDTISATYQVDVQVEHVAGRLVVVPRARGRHGVSLGHGRRDSHGNDNLS